MTRGLGAILTLAGAAGFGSAAAALEFGPAAEVLCIAPYEAVIAPDVSGLDRADVPDWLEEPGEVPVYAVDNLFLVIEGAFASEAVRCTVHARLDPEELNTARLWFAGWAEMAVREGRYQTLDGTDDVLESVAWREPRMRVAFRIDGEIARLVVEDTEQEA